MAHDTPSHNLARERLMKEIKAGGAGHGRAPGQDVARLWRRRRRRRRRDACPGAARREVDGRNDSNIYILTPGGGAFNEIPQPATIHVRAILRRACMNPSVPKNRCLVTALFASIAARTVPAEK